MCVFYLCVEILVGRHLPLRSESSDEAVEDAGLLDHCRLIEMVAETQPPLRLPPLGNQPGHQTNRHI